MPKLKDILHRIQILHTVGHTHTPIRGISFDSRQVEAGYVFVATKGTQTDGHQYIQKAIEKGAVAVVCQELPKQIVPQVCYVQVYDSSVALGYMAANYYDNPSDKLQVVAVTGTNGKTTSVTLLYQLFKNLGYKVGMLSTVQNYIDEEIVAATHTTPDSIQTNYLMHQMVLKGCTYCFMEASSHAIHQNRMAGIRLSGAVFTNITHDHLDYHGTFENYIKAKKKLFDELPSSAFALSNIDDKRGEVMLQNTRATKHFFSLHRSAEFKARMLSNTLSGLELEINNRHVWCKLVGEFNAYNLLGAYAVAVLLGIDNEKVLTALSVLPGAKGRFETIRSKLGIIAIVDYAHTPDALENVLKTLTELRTRNEKLITVVGCGGNRDATKRPAMAKIACTYSDKVILTSDNPRKEDPEKIIDDMIQGVPAASFKKYERCVDRKDAIHRAVEIAQPYDIILVAGKGHEDYQEIMDKKYPFDDKIQVYEALSHFNK